MLVWVGKPLQFLHGPLLKDTCCMACVVYEFKDSEAYISFGGGVIICLHMTV